MSQTGEANQRKTYIDVIKGFCALCVIITHSYFLDSQRKLLLFPFWVDMAVPMFMLITGYLYTKSYISNNCFNIKTTYNLNIILRKLNRILVPFVFIFIIEQLLSLLFTGNHFNISSIIKLFVSGGVGPGSYYTPVMIQLIFIFPLVFLTIKRSNLAGGGCCGGDKRII